MKTKIDWMFLNFFFLSLYIWFSWILNIKYPWQEFLEMKCINSKIKKGKVTFDFLCNIVSSVQANLFTQSGIIQGRPSSISDFNTFPSWSYAPIKFRWALEHLCHMDTFSHFFFMNLYLHHNPLKNYLICIKSNLY